MTAITLIAEGEKNQCSEGVQSVHIQCSDEAKVGRQEVSEGRGATGSGLFGHFRLNL